MHSDLPSGTVTFLFTDVEGSTKLLDELGSEGYAEALAAQRRIVRAACAAQGGVEVDTQGDAFFFAFPTAPGALAAAKALTEGLSSGPIRVRVGVHTGTPLLAEEGYVGDDVHRAARIAASGHGGQVLVSSSTATLVELQLRDLGAHRFKDLTAADLKSPAEDSPPRSRATMSCRRGSAATRRCQRRRTDNAKLSFPASSEVERTGIEPVTSGLQSRRSPS
jgi:class 3 adenylate cyclase